MPGKYSKEYYRKNKRQYFLRNLNNSYNLSEEDYLDLLSGQNNKCKLCDQERKLQVDHCHETNKIRGLLCMPCNVGLGMLGDNVEGLEKALRYIKGELQ
jgi:hypothetical protein